MDPPNHHCSIIVLFFTSSFSSPSSNIGSYGSDFNGSGYGDSGYASGASSHGAIINGSIISSDASNNNNNISSSITGYNINGINDSVNNVDQGLFDNSNNNNNMITVPSGKRAMTNLRESRLPTIVLIDIDHTDGVSRDLYARRESFVAMKDGISLPEFTTTKDPLYGLELLKYINSEVSKGNLEQAIPIVCSWNDSPELMLDCLNKGAADYLIKPIRQEVAKTVFLMDWVAIMTQEFPKPLIRRISNFEERLDDFFIKDKWLAETIIEYYTPPELDINIAYIPRLDSASELERVNYLKKQLTNWEFDAQKLSEEDLLRCVVIIFEHVMDLDDLRQLNVPSEQLHRFLLAIRQSYYDSNPYHNFTHAVDVLQAMFFFLCEMGLIPLFFSSTSSDADSFALLLASIGHDVGHPGVNNFFLINSQTPLAHLYNDKSVLESFHAMTLFTLMQKYGFKVYEGETEYNSKYAVNAILATDMGLHNEYVVKIRDQKKRLGSGNFDIKSEQEKNIVVGALIKCADISNAARPYHIAAEWSDVLLKEFTCQGNLEKKLGLPVNPINNGQISQSDSQISFIDIFAMPLFKSVSELIPELKFCVNIINSNRKVWQDKKDDFGDSTNTTISNSNDDDDARSIKHNSTGKDSGINVDSRQNSPIVSVPAARILLSHQSSLTYLRPINPNLLDGGSEVESQYSTNEALSTAEASDAPLTQHNQQLQNGDDDGSIDGASSNLPNNSGNDDSRIIIQGCSPPQP
nr:11085_t:CDS:10 [Entrophospora candida]